MQHQDDLPELIYTESCNGEIGQAPCISLQRCGNRMSNLPANRPDGNVDAVRVMLLGVNDSGRPSVGIDLGYACTQPHGYSHNNHHGQQHGHAQSQASSNHNHQAHSRSSSGESAGYGPGHASPNSSFSGTAGAHNSSSLSESVSFDSAGTFSPSPEGSPARRGMGSGTDYGSPGLGTHDYGRCSPPLSVSPGVASTHSRASTIRASRPASPFVFQRPFTPSKAPNTPSVRRSFIFSEWAANNRQTFVFEGSHQGTACVHVRMYVRIYATFVFEGSHQGTACVYVRMCVCVYRRACFFHLHLSNFM
jgi:hypothetical protein